MIQYKGLPHFPLGPIILTTFPENPETMRVSGLGSDSFNGISIRTNGAKEWEAKFAPVPMKAGVGLTATYNILDNWGRNKTVAQYGISVDEATGKAVLVVNSKFICKNFRLVGTLNGKEVFSRDYVKPDEPGCNWLAVAGFVLAVAVAVLDAVDYKKEVERDGAGHITKTTTTTSFGGAGMVVPGDGTGHGYEDQQYQVDHMYISFTSDFGDEGEPYSHQGMINEVQITPRGFEELTFIDETYSLEG